jgi:hypothetical protein
MPAVKLAGPLLLGLACALGACDKSARPAHDGTLVVGLGMPMREVLRHSTASLRREALRAAYSSAGSEFDCELAGGTLRFPRCGGLSLDVAGPDEIVTDIALSVGPRDASWPTFTKAMRGVAARLAADGWQPKLERGGQALEPFLAQDAGKAAIALSEPVLFQWTKEKALVILGMRVASGSNGSRIWADLSFSRDAAALP